ncbi:MAG: hypothetical protein KGJ86_14965 [Chloroflexota bacterium]|nr:hypothetical protein [Chloroflexota bacterium]
MRLEPRRIGRAGQVQHLRDGEELVQAAFDGGVEPVRSLAAAEAEQQRLTGIEAQALLGRAPVERMQQLRANGITGDKGLAPRQSPGGLSHR